MSADFPEWPPGLWRRIVLWPQPGWIGGALEDDVHRFHIRMEHAEGRITGVRAEAVRHPWTGCPGAAPYIEGDLQGELLVDTARRDPMLHCTHLFDLAVVMAAHADYRESTQYDLRVADRVDERTTATLEENGVEKVRWQLNGTGITGDAPWGGRDLRQLSHWKRELPPIDAERATVLRRAVFVSGARQFEPPTDRAFDVAELRGGVCFNFRSPQAEQSTRMPNWRTDFSTSGGEPLLGFDPEAVFAAM